jgi:hypothetical protein
MNYIKNIFRLTIVFTLILFFNKGYSQDFTIEDLLNFKNLNKQSSELYLTNRGYKLYEHSLNDNGDEKESFKIYDFLDRIHYSNFTLYRNKDSTIKSVHFGFNNFKLSSTLSTQLKKMGFKLMSNYFAEGAPIMIYNYQRNNIDIRFDERYEFNNCFFEDCVDYNISISF